ncbi:hypothetical protein B9T10_01920 [Wohlfahrtiimonas chitiniclastica]|uniref:DMT family transporter n=1 Tax=Wohlfahrtiimonas chitiniclastica TaxID=400946 RepID=UPI000B98E209|nr:DMT family transporter [Wohlfahrtiimonas chitiniclastica]OYQ90099.1 hypothetical protein B9T10_01920 [Wohlfahrtiimonas chitiniclastica]
MQKPMMGACWMMATGIAFAAINVITPYISQQYPISSSWIAFFQYSFAFCFLLPTFLKAGLKTVAKTERFWIHFLRILAAIVGVQLWVKALNLQFPIGEGVALLMTSPLFASIGAFLFLKEKATSVRILVTLMGFVGAILILNPSYAAMNYVAFLPLAAAFFWAIYSLLIKYLADKDHPLTLLFYLYLIMFPINLVLALTDNFTHALKVEHLVWDMGLMGYLLVLGFLTMIAQFTLVKAYHVADAIYIQPFDYLKLPLNTLLGFVFFGWTVGTQFWLGAIIMVAALLYITYFESK